MGAGHEFNVRIALLVKQELDEAMVVELRLDNKLDKFVEKALVGENLH